MNSKERKAFSSVPVLFAVLIVYSLCILGAYHYERLTGDATLYLSIAEKYVNGDFSNAVNGYWGPLLSWLLVPLLLLGADHVTAINALNLLFGLLTIIGVWKLSYRFEMSEGIRRAVLLPLAPVLLFISLIEPMDFLLLCVLVYYLAIVFGDDYPDRASRALAAGVLGACAYFSKPYGFPFFITHFLLINGLHYFKGPSQARRRNVLRNLAAGVMVFFLLSGIWIGLISSKYNRLTFSNMGRGVFASLGPESRHDTLEKGDPIFFEGFFAPPNDTAFVIYEDPTYARKSTWSPLESKSTFKHYMSNLIENIFECFRIYESYSRLAVSIVIIYVLFLFYQPVRTILSRGDLLYPLFTIILYTGGYLPFHYETRYLWIVNILLLLMGGALLNELFRKEFFHKGTMRTTLTTLFIVSFMITPLKASVEIGENHINREMYMLGTELETRYGIRGNIASNRKITEVASHDSWHNTFRLAYWLKSRYYGQAKEGMSPGGLEEELKKYDIDYYFYWKSAEGPPEFLTHCKEITGGQVEGLRIYSLKEKGE